MRQPAAAEAQENANVGAIWGNDVTLGWQSFRVQESLLWGTAIGAILCDPVRAPTRIRTDFPYRRYLCRGQTPVGQSSWGGVRKRRLGPLGGGAFFAYRR